MSSPTVPPKCGDPSFNCGDPVCKSFDDIPKIFDPHLAIPEIKELKNLAEEYSKKAAYPNPFIVVEGLDGVGKTTLVTNLRERLGAPIFDNPPKDISEYRKIMVKLQCEPVLRAFYSLGNYLVAEDIKRSLEESPVVLDRFWHSTAAYAIAIKAKDGSIPPKGSPIYQWPADLLKPSAVILLELSENDRLLRMRERKEEETNEELQLKKSQLLRERLIGAYKNMENPSCITIDASKSKEEVCESVITELRNRKILPSRLPESYSNTFFQILDPFCF